MKRYGIGWIAGAALLIAGVGLAGVLLERERSPVARECVLHARATIVPRDTPIGRQLEWDSDLLALRSDDPHEWRDVEIAIYGFLTTAKTGKQQTGAYRYRTDRISANSLKAVSLRDFMKSDGSRWVPTTMSVDDVEVKATMRGVPCRTEAVKLGKP